MKKIIGIILVMIVAMTLSGCQNEVTIQPDIINVEIMNTKWEDERIVTDVYITNGTKEDVDIDYLELILYLPDGVTQFSAAGYDILATVNAKSYNKYHVEFTSEFIKMTKSQFEALDISLDDLELIFGYN